MSISDHVSNSYQLLIHAFIILTGLMAKFVFIDVNSFFQKSDDRTEVQQVAIMLLVHLTYGI